MNFIDPLTFRSDSHLGTPGLFRAYRMGNVAIANAPGTGVADDKSVYAYVPDIIRYFLNEEPLLANVETHLCREPAGLEYTLDDLDRPVVKMVGESGGYGMLVGPHATPGERAAYAEEIRRLGRGSAKPTAMMNLSGARSMTSTFGWDGPFACGDAFTRIEPASPRRAGPGSSRAARRPTPSPWSCRERPGRGAEPRFGGARSLGAAENETCHVVGSGSARRIGTDHVPHVAHDLLR